MTLRLLRLCQAADRACPCTRPGHGSPFGHPSAPLHSLQGLPAAWHGRLRCACDQGAVCPAGTAAGTAPRVLKDNPWNLAHAPYSAHLCSTSVAVQHMVRGIQRNGLCETFNGFIILFCLERGIPLGLQPRGQRASSAEVSRLCPCTCINAPCHLQRIRHYNHTCSYMQER
jgi:hypothetical protein